MLSFIDWCIAHGRGVQFVYEINKLQEDKRKTHINLLWDRLSMSVRRKFKDIPLEVETAIRELISSPSFDVNVSDSHGASPLVLVVAKPTLRKFLPDVLAKKPKLGLGLINGKTAMALAMESGDRAVVDQLIAAGDNLLDHITESPACFEYF